MMSFCARLSRSKELCIWTKHWEKKQEKKKNQPENTHTDEQNAINRQSERVSRLQYVRIHPVHL